MTHTWRTAFLRQAKSDFEVFEHLRRMPHDVCHRLHYLQMLTEKTAKAFVAHGIQAPPCSHKALLNLLKVAEWNQDLMQLCRFSRLDQYRNYLRSLHPLADKIESLAPALSNGPNAEYPWQDGSGVIRAPAEYDFRDFDLKNPAGMIKMVKFIETCLRYLEAP